jgi:uncharacterized protein YcfL
MACAVVALSACESGQRPDSSAADGSAVHAGDSEVVVLDDDLRRLLEFSPATRIRVGGRPLQVEVIGRNLAANAFLIDYRFVFFDDQGHAVAASDEWTIVRLDPGAATTLRGVAADGSASAHHLEVRWAR